MSSPGHRVGCQASEHAHVGRRRLIEAGGLALLGVGLGDLLRMEARAAASQQPRAKSVVFIFQSGGPSQHETFDPKPDAPAEIRGEYGTTATRVPGFRICEYLPQLAARAERYTVVRTMHHTAERQFRSEHNAAQYLLNTGTCALPPGENTNTIALQRPRRFEWPSIGSTIAYALPRRDAFGLPPVIEIPRKGLPIPGTGPGMLGATYSHWMVDLAPPCHTPDGGGSCPNCFAHDQPNDPRRGRGKQPGAWWDDSSCRNPDFHLPDLGLESGLTLDALRGRAALLRELDQARRALDAEPAVRGMDAYRRQAWELILGQKGKHNPFDLTQETDPTRDLYGRQEWGQAFLVARRLVEAGVRMVQVNLRGWDTHQNAFRDLKGHLLPSLDRCLSGFLDDLQARGMLDETLIVMCGEMGRTPRVSPIAVGGINASGEVFTPGRHHWGDVFPCLLAGGGIQPGRVIGQTDKSAGAPVTEAYTPSDLAATIFHLLGVKPEQAFLDAEKRPHQIFLGRPIQAVL
jgi:uncharacterized protein (DUF1501 family)